MKKGLMAAIIVVAMLIGLVFGFYLAGMSKSTSLISAQNLSNSTKRGDFKNTFADGWEAARQKLASANFIMSSVFSLPGQVVEVKGNEVVFTTNLINPLDDEALKTRTAVVDNNTKITIWKLKPAEQAAKDREESQKEITSLQKENNALQIDLNSCFGANPAMMAGEGESDSCKAARKRSEEIMRAINLASQKMDGYEKIEDAKLSDIKSGWNILAMSLMVKNEESAGPAGMMNQYENVANSQKFTASSIEVREIFIMPVAAPANIEAPAASKAITETPNPATPTVEE